MERRIINPWNWQEQQGWSWGIEVSGAQKTLSFCDVSQVIYRERVLAGQLDGIEQYGLAASVVADEPVRPSYDAGVAAAAADLCIAKLLMP